MRIHKKTISYLVLICLLSCILTGCPSPGDESKLAEQHVSQAVSLAEEELTKIYPDAIIKPKSFYGISGVQTGPDHLMTDWVMGEYLDNGKEEILINVLTNDIFVTSEWHIINSYGMKLARDLYGLDDTSLDGSVSGYMEMPYCTDEPDKYGNLKIWNMLPLGSMVNDEFAGNLLNNEDYCFLYELSVNSDVDMKLFEETDYSSLGSNVHIQVKQYDNKYFNADTDQPIAVFDGAIPLI